MNTSIQAQPVSGRVTFLEGQGGLLSLGPLVVVNERCKLPLSLLGLVLMCSLLTGCMASMATMNRAEGRYTFPSSHDRPPLEPHPAYYALLAMTVPFDIVTLPIQIPVFVLTFNVPEPKKTEIKPTQ